MRVTSRPDATRLKPPHHALPAMTSMSRAGNSLSRRLFTLARIAAATDAEVKAQYQAARAALDDQRRYRDHIRQGRERLIARMHNHVTTLEKFQLAATGLEASRAAATADGRQLEELSQDVAASGEALAEVELGVPATRAVADQA